VGSQDKALRKTAIPYYANVWGYNRGQFSDENISSADRIGDLSKMQPSDYFTQTSIAAVNAIRVLQPQYGDIIEANLNLRFRTANAEGARLFRIAIGYFDGLYDAETSYTEDYITASHRKITGRDAPYNIPPASSLSVPRLNLQPDMYHDGDSQYRDDAFVVLLCFDQAPSKGAGYEFTKFDIECTMQMGLL
jgi:hypothetical protein